MRRLAAYRGHPVADWLLEDDLLIKQWAGLQTPTAGLEDDIDWAREDALEELTERFVSRLNERMPRETRRGGLLRAVRNWLGTRDLMLARKAVRTEMDDFLKKVESTPITPDGRPKEESLPEYASTGGRKPVPVVQAGLVNLASRVLDIAFWSIRTADPFMPPDNEELSNDARQAAQAAREGAMNLFKLHRRRFVCFWLGAARLCVVAALLAHVILRDTFERVNGEPFSLVSGTSAWPAEIVRLLVVVLAICFAFGLSHKMRESFAFLTRLFRFSPPADKAPLGTGRVCAQVIWDDYQKDSCFRKRLFPIAVLLILYYVGLLSIYQAEGEAAFSPVRGDFLKGLNTIFVYLSVWSSLLLAFLTVDAARRCRDFINKISARPTQYPGATRRHFSRQMGRIDLDYLDEWIDLQLIAELTEQVGQLVYYPAGLVLLLLLARNSWWDCWSWPVSLIIIFIINFVLAFASVVILQRAALDAKRKAEQSLAAKVKKLRAETAATKAENAAGQAEKLLEEIRDLRRGAFVPFWQNPVVGALFLSSGGTTMLQMFIWFMGR